MKAVFPPDEFGVSMSHLGALRMRALFSLVQ
jgi:hypothetical protein